MFLNLSLIYCFTIIHHYLFTNCSTLQFTSSTSLPILWVPFANAKLAWLKTSIHCASKWTKCQSKLCEKGVTVFQPNYRTYPYKRIVKQFHCLQITGSILFVYFFITVYVVGTHLNCINLLMQFKWVPTAYAFYKKKRKKK